ncbi:B12-binding domain-containing radical SAM protein [Aureibacter tunicatorum]|uniref:Radical SAM superfamily enzyme YgiQ (UPF0313 family) n=1 Tax=Aureibacter tunicatorum TaxID=866807 RepID=A0AAE4BUK2_9BACT|nr:radical SAM protein [Aureibacter tunicatorum]MDR6240853.1 radical SAM superfamily enzyme YgiQ (UPF0313 family) [Aureibacter tunicatorum]BDD06813.1 B12-binding domain-containing radical SAM protein [Aureibacter tunicatorum]
MKIYLIKASSGSSYSEYKAETGGPPQNIFSAAAAIPEHIELEMCDETIGMKTNFQSEADIVAIFMSTPDAYRAYEIAQKFKAKGKTTILSGLHTKFLPQEASLHADALILGESEGLWENIIQDFQQGTLKSKYQRTSTFDLAELKPYPTNIIPVSKYNWVWSVVVTRGCPMQCEFCLVHDFFDKFTLRPIENIVEEIKELKKLGVEWVELHSDNLTHNKKYALELFKALEPLDMNFYGETTIMIARDQELLKAAQRAGVKTLLFGIETPDEQALKDQKKAFVKPDKIKEYVNIIKSHGIEVVGDFLFGFDAHDKNIFDQTIDFIQEIKVDKAYPHLMIPFPGSETFKKLDKQERILTKDWSKYDGSHAVFQPTNMTPEELEMGTWKVYQAIEKHEKYIKNQSSKIDKSLKNKAETNMLTSKWKTLLAIALLPFALIFEMSNFYFAGLFILWSYQGIKHKSTFFIERIEKNENPVLFWIVSILWIVLSIWSLIYSEPIIDLWYYR